MLILDTTFHIEEFVPKETFEKWGEKSIWFINPNIVLFSQWLKTTLDDVSVVINDWKWGGSYNYSGYRPPDCAIGAKESSHRRGIAVDIKIKGYHPERIRDLIRQNFQMLNERFGVTGYEVGTDTWVHVDFRWTNIDKLYEIPIPK